MVNGDFHEIAYREGIIGTITHTQMYHNDMKMVLDRYTTIQEGFVVKPRHW